MAMKNGSCLTWAAHLLSQTVSEFGLVGTGLGAHPYSAMLPCRSPIYASALLSENTAVSGPSVSATSEKSLRPPSAQPLPAGFPPAREKHGWGKYEASWSMYKPDAPRSD